MVTTEKITDLLTELSVLEGAPQKLRLFVLELALTPADDKWETAELGSVVDVFNGDSIASSEKELKYAGNSEGRPYIATKDVRGWFGTIDYENGVRIPEKESKFKVARSNSVLICSEGGSAGKKIGFVKEDVCFGNKLFCCSPHSDVLLPEYLLRLLQSKSFFDRFSRQITGIIGGVSLANFKKISISYPREVEAQKSILRLVDNIFSHIENVESSSENAISSKRALGACLLNALVTHNARETASTSIFQNFESIFDDGQQLTRLKETFLELAVTGRLNTNNENESAVTTGQILDTRTKTALSTPVESPQCDGMPPVPANWRWIELGKLVNPSRPISYGVIKLGAETKGGVPTLRCSDVKFRYIDSSSIKLVSEDIEAAYGRTRLLGGEVVFNIRGTLGGVALVPDDMAGFNIAREVAMIDPNSLIHPRYLLAVLSSPLIQRAVNDNLKGIAYRGLNLGTLSRFVVPVPPIEEQFRLVAVVEEFLAAILELETLVSAKEEIGQALLEALVTRETFLAPLPPSDGLSSAIPALPDQTVSERVVSDSAEGDLTARKQYDTSLQDALLVSALVAAFYADGGQPLGNFRLQKAVYFAKRFMGESIRDMGYLKKAAGPYNPTLKYSGGISIAKRNSWIREARGIYGFGHIPGHESGAWVDRARHLGFDDVASRVAQTFKRPKDNVQWETLATVDFAVQELYQTLGRRPSPKIVMDYLAVDYDWRHKIQKLALTELSVSSAMVEAHALFGGYRGH